MANRWVDMPSTAANDDKPPAESIALRMALIPELNMTFNSKSNVTFNSPAHNLFSLLRMRPIDRTLLLAEERGMNQSDLARELGVPPQAITNWKSRGMPAAHMVSLSFSLQLKVTYRQVVHLIALLALYFPG